MSKLAERVTLLEATLAFLVGEIQTAINEKWNLSGHYRRTKLKKAVASAGQILAGEILADEPEEETHVTDEA